MRFLVCSLLSLTLLGCSQAGNNAKKSPETKSRGKLGISVLTMRNPFFKVIADTFTEEATKAGYEVLAMDGDNSVDKQRAQVKDFLQQKVAAIVLCPCDPRAIGPVIQEANAADVPVFTADLACLVPEARVVSHIATDNYSGGKLAGEAMIEALGTQKPRKIAILHYPEAESCIQRVKGFEEVIQAYNQRHPDAKFDIVRKLSGSGHRDVGFKAAQAILDAVPDLDGLFAINDPSALGAHAALEAAKRTGAVKIIAFDGQPEGKQAIKEGKIYADPIQYPDKIARTTFESIQKYLAGETLPAEILIPTTLYRKADADQDPALK